MRWPRRRIRSRSGEDRVGTLERRVGDLEDVVQLALAPDRVEDLERRLADATISLPSAEELLELRLQTAKVSGDLRRLRIEVRDEIGRLADAVAATAAPADRQG